MLQLSISTVYTLCVGVPLDASGNTMFTNSHTPVLADFAIDKNTALNASGTLASDSSGNIYWTCTVSDFAAAGPHQIVCVNATYAMLPKELMIGNLSASSGGTTNLSSSVTVVQS